MGQDKARLYRLALKVKETSKNEADSCDFYGRPNSAKKRLATIAMRTFMKEAKILGLTIQEELDFLDSLNK